MTIKKMKDTSKPNKYKHFTKEMHEAMIKKIIESKNKRKKENKNEHILERFK